MYKIVLNITKYNYFKVNPFIFYYYSTLSALKLDFSIEREKVERKLLSTDQEN